MQDGPTEVGKLHERITLDCPLTSCLKHLGRTWNKCCCQAWKKTDLSLRQQHRTSNVLILLHQTMILDDLERLSFWNCCQDICHWFAALDLNLLLNLFLCQIRFYFSSKFVWRHNFRLFIAIWSVLFLWCVKLSILPYECVAVCSYSSPGVWSVG